MKTGFTLIELMVVLVILGLLATFIGPAILGKPDEARVIKTKNDMSAIETALKMYKVDNSLYPSTEQGLGALIEKPTIDPVPRNWNSSGYMDLTDLPVDPWGMQFIYRSPTDVEDRDYEIISYGADGKEGGTGVSADIKSFEIQ